MEKKRPGSRYAPSSRLQRWLSFLAGLFRHVRRVSHEEPAALLDGQDGQLTKTAQSVDNNILGHFVLYTPTWKYITARTGFPAGRRNYLAGGGAE